MGKGLWARVRRIEGAQPPRPLKVIRVVLTDQMSAAERASREAKAAREAAAAQGCGYDVLTIRRRIVSAPADGR